MSQDAQPHPEYPKINSLFKRDPAQHNRMIMGHYADETFRALESLPWRVEEKIDGMNIRVKWDSRAFKVTYAGRTNAATIHPELIERLDYLFNRDYMAACFPDDATLYGEGFGNGIQKGGCYLPGKDFALFDVRVGPWWLRREPVWDIANRLGLRTPKQYGDMTLPDMVEFVRNMPMEEMECGPYRPEGVVARPTVDLLDRAGRRIITKLKVKDFVAKARGV